MKQQELPLFPLNTVLFPGMSLPLHIFEERYKLMIGQCIKDSQPFGVVLLKEGAEVGPNGSIYRVGTTAHITQVERLSGGRLNIATLGFNRFRVLNVNQQRPFLTAQVEDYPLLETHNPATQDMATRLKPVLQNYIDILGTLDNLDLKPELLPVEPMTLAFFAAIILRTPMKDKQRLLDMPDLLSLLRVERKMVYREAQILKFLLENGVRWRDDPRPFSIN